MKNGPAPDKPSKSFMQLAAAQHPDSEKQKRTLHLFAIGRARAA